MRILIIFLFGLINWHLFSQQSWMVLDAGTEYSAGIQSDGTLWTWGSNFNGQLGTGDNNVKEIPTQVGNDTNWQNISCGAFHMIALKTDGTLWAWGGNGVYQLGIGNTSDSNIPVQIGSDNDWQFIAAGYAHNLAIKTDGTLWGWGWNFYGQVGDNSTNDVQIPTQIGTDNSWEKLALGVAHSMAIKSDGSLWTAGTNLTGQLGIDGLTQSYEFIQVGLASWIEVSCGHEYTSGIQSDNTLWSWGFNGNGQLGLGHNSQVDEPTQVGTNNNWSFINCGSASNFAINNTEELYASGYNQQGTLGDGSGADKNTFDYITDDVYQVWGAKGASESGNVFGHHALLLKNASMHVICVTGANYTYQLGNNTDVLNLSFECETGNLEEINSISEFVASNIVIYPNPTTDIITIEIENNLASNLILYNNLGEKVLDANLGSEETISLKHLDQGVYFYEIIDDNGHLNKGKIVVQ
jgi:hypothetical protein